MGESAFGLNPNLVGESWFSNPRPTGAFSSSGGGVGVLGGTGSGISDAMLKFKGVTVIVVANGETLGK